jgi:hypothetical protein
MAEPTETAAARDLLWNLDFSNPGQPQASAEEFAVTTQASADLMLEPEPMPEPSPKPRPPALKLVAAPSLDEEDEAGVTEHPSQTSAIADLIAAEDMPSDGGDFSDTDSDEEDDVVIEPIVNRPLALSRGISRDLQLQTTTSLVRRASVSGALLKHP